MCFDNMITWALILSTVALSQDLLSARFGFSIEDAGAIAMAPYLVIILSIPLVVKIANHNRMFLIYMIAVFNILTYFIWFVMPDCD